MGLASGRADQYLADQVARACTQPGLGVRRQAVVARLR